ncbi:GNAT family N-acetyltransferase [Longimicrobium sp.]|uniref:GNAT family N-acetyltransferase n=1 Tax=Longimicrobium sp. TaxID=2029185 RepID=UPI002E2EE566|nr:GNAT family N-acetyltransferase [Longimicrobium sp.]HEX6041859.1 GNAT family N-acetyltransferase [Longimicrobium sp.]
MEEHEFRPLEHSDTELEEVSGLLRRVFPHAPHLTPAYLRWLYVENPDGRALGYNAYHEGRLVGHCAGQPLTARVEGETLRGILLVNAAVEPGHVRRNLTRRTTDPMFDQAARAGYAFSIAVGNANSTLPLLTRFVMVGPLEARVGLGLPRRRGTRTAPSWERVWSGDAIRWRLANPERPYTVRNRAGRAAVTAPAGRAGFGAVLYDGADGWGLADTGGRPAGPLRVWLGRDPAVEWGRSPFVPLPMKLRPSPLNLVFKDLTGRGLHPDAARVVFRAIDFDAW